MFFPTRNMKIKLSLALFSMVFCGTIYACGGVGFQVFTGEIKYVQNPANPLFCEATITLDFDVNQNLADDSIMVDWGDGNANAVYAVSVTPDSAANLEQGFNRFFRHVYSGKHGYASTALGGTYFISLPGQYRVNNASNIASGSMASLPYYIQARVNIDTTMYLDQTPIMPPPGIGYSGLDTFEQNAILTYSPLGDSVVFELVTPYQYRSIPVPQYLLPNQLCQAGNSFSIDAHTGEILWITPCIQGQFDIAILISIYRNGHLLGNFMRDETIYVSNQGVNSVNQYSPVADIKLYPNPAGGNLVVDFSKEVSSKTLLSIIATTGETVKQLIPEGNHTNVDVSSLASGIYFLCLQHGGQTFMKKFVKE